MMIRPESVQELETKVVHLFNMKQTKLELCKSHTHMLRYEISTEQIQDLNTLTCRNSIELVTVLHETHNYLKSS